MTWTRNGDLYLDGADEDKNIAFEFISRDDVYEWRKENEEAAATFTLYDVKGTAQQLRKELVSYGPRGKTSEGRGFFFVPISEKNLYLNLYCVTQKDYRLNKREREFIRFLRDFATLDGQKS